MFQVSVIGGSSPNRETLDLAYKVGQTIAELNMVLVCGGLFGVMEAACKGAKSKGGLTVGIIPQGDKSYANPYVDIMIPTGMGYARNCIVAYSGDVVVALSGSYGTLSEIAYALTSGKIVLSLGSWDIEGVEKLKDIDELKKRLLEIRDGGRK